MLVLTNGANSTGRHGGLRVFLLMKPLLHENIERKASSF